MGLGNMGRLIRHYLCSTLSVTVLQSIGWFLLGSLAMFVFISSRKFPGDDAHLHHHDQPQRLVRSENSFHHPMSKHPQHQDTWQEQSGIVSLVKSISSIGGLADYIVEPTTSTTTPQPSASIDSRKIMAQKSSVSKNDANMTSETIDRLLTDPVANQTDVAGLLAQRVRILCMVLTTTKYHNNRCAAVKETWGKRCTKIVFISDSVDDSLPSIIASNLSDYAHLWSKTRGGFRWAYDNHLNDFDWFMKADDDTFVILENLRALLLQYSPDDPVFMGYTFGRDDWFQPKSYTSGGAGYVLSRRALQRLVVESFSMPVYCSYVGKGGAEDVEMGRCLENIGISPTDSRDEFGRQRFNPFTPNYHLNKGTSPPDMWIWSYSKYPYREGPDCCSDLAATFHYVHPEEMRVMEYVVYRLKLFGKGLFEPVGGAIESREAAAYKAVMQVLAKNNYLASSSSSSSLSDDKTVKPTVSARRHRYSSRAASQSQQSTQPAPVTQPNNDEQSPSTIAPTSVEATESAEAYSTKIPIK